MYRCASCSIHACNYENNNYPTPNCPCVAADMPEIKELYRENENFKIAQQSTFCVNAGYGVKTRLEETMDFAHMCEYKNIGLAFCIGLASEGKMLNKILSYNGFTVHAIVCKIGAFSKELVGLKGTTVTMCNPIGQAKLLNEAKTDFNILLGLCVGHDSLFMKYSEAPVTVFAVKDRVLAHNPLGAIYLAEFYYKDKLFPQKESHSSDSNNG